MATIKSLQRSRSWTLPMLIGINAFSSLDIDWCVKSTQSSLCLLNLYFGETIPNPSECTPALPSLWLSGFICCSRKTSYLDQNFYFKWQHRKYCQTCN